METTVLIPAINYDVTTPEGCVLVEVGYHASLDGYISPFPYKIEPEYWSKPKVEKFSDFCADQYNKAKAYGTQTETLDESSEI